MSSATIAGRRRAFTLRAPALLEPLGRALLRATLDRLVHGRLEVIDPSGERLVGQGKAAGPRATVRVLDRRTYAALALGGGMGAAEAYIAGLWTSDELPAVIELLALNADALASVRGPAARALEPALRAAHWLRRNTRAGSRRNIVAHYDLSNEFFATFLDPSMTYSSGVYATPGATLDDAQAEKIDRACRKLRLRPGDHLLEIGTGWGALAIHATRRYGCRVTTTTISDRQHELASRRVQDAGLSGRVRVLKTDYRDLEGRYDKLVSIEMIEAVGREYLGEFLARCADLLEPDGLALIQAITIRDAVDLDASRRVDFLKRYVFPGSCLVGLARFGEEMRERTDFDLVHLEQLGEHYARTLADWRRRFHDAGPRVRGMGFDEGFIRLWDYYLAYCEGAMRARRCGVAQILLAKPLARPGDIDPASRGFTTPQALIEQLAPTRPQAEPARA